MKLKPLSVTLKIIGYLSLILLISAPVVYLFEGLDMEGMHVWMIVATLIWFASQIIQAVVQPQLQE